MRVIICGAGRVGFGIARALVRENADITVIDRSAELISRISEDLEVRGVVGHGSHPNILANAGAESADMVIAVTLSDEVNMVACQICHSLFKVPTKIARVRAQSYLDPAYKDLFSRAHMPIDVIISPEIEVGRAVLERLKTPGAAVSRAFADGAVYAIGVRIDEDCPIIETPIEQIRELFPRLKIEIVGVRRAGKVFTPNDDTQLAPGDDLYFIAAAEEVDHALEVIGREERSARRVVLVGGGNVGLYVAEALEKSRSVKTRLIESDMERAQKIADRLRRTIVINGSGLDTDILREAGIQDAEALVALTNDDRVNVLAAVIGKREGAKRTISLVNNQEYAPLSEAVGVDIAVDPRASTISTILQQVRRGRIKSVYPVADGAAEVLEAIALKTSPIVGEPLSRVELPEGVLLGAVVKNGAVELPGPNTVAEAGDRIILFALKDAVAKVEQMFRVSLEYF
ncbi:MAG: Trk system potassium transporter TrkA [Pseudomonadota bacterium]